MRRAGAGWVGVLEKTTIRDKARSIWSRGAKRNIAKLVEVSWNHNIQYHRAVIQAIPATCRRALDVGCGRGALAQKLARRSDAVLAVDVDQECLMRAQAALHGEPRITFMQGDVLTAPLVEDSFDFIAVVATLHHLPLRAGLVRIRNLLRPGGVVAIVGLYRTASPVDYAFAAAAHPISRGIRLLRGEDEVGAPIADPVESLKEIRMACHALFPGCVFKRRFFFRYTLTWQKPRSE